MRKLFVLIMMTAFASSAHALIGNQGSGAYQTATGAVKNLEQIYVKVKNSHSAALTIGQVVVDDTTDDDGVSVNASTTANLTPRCIIAETSCAVGAMCKCQVYGYHSSVAFDKTNANGAATAGESGYISENFAGYVEAKPYTSSDDDDKHIGVFLDSPSASGATEFFINLL
jgi:hypothetical protein